MHVYDGVCTVHACRDQATSPVSRLSPSISVWVLGWTSDCQMCGKCFKLQSCGAGPRVSLTSTEIHVCCGRATTSHQRATGTSTILECQFSCGPLSGPGLYIGVCNAELCLHIRATASSPQHIAHLLELHVYQNFNYSMKFKNSIKFSFLPRGWQHSYLMWSRRSAAL